MSLINYILQSYREQRILCGNINIYVYEIKNNCNFSIINNDSVLHEQQNTAVLWPNKALHS